MRVLVAHDIPSSRTGGMSRIMAFTHDRLAARGYDTDYFCREDAPAGLAALRRFSFPMALRRHTRDAARHGRPYHILNIHEPSALPSVLGRDTLGRPMIVVTTHGVEQRAWELAIEEGRLGRGGPSLKTRIVYPLSSLWQSRLGFTRADHVFCLNEEDRTYLTTEFSVPASRITRIFPGADGVYSDAARARDYRGAHRLLFAATWRKNKGIDDLVPAFVALHTRYPHLTLTVLGSGVPDEVVRGAFPEAVRSAVHCVTTRSDEAAAAVYAGADIFVLPSLFEGTPLTLIEAMASGLPIVTTAVCGMKDVIQSARNGLLVPVRSPDSIVTAVGELIDRQDLRRQLGTTAQRDATTLYTWDRSAERVAEAYDRLLGQSARVGHPANVHVAQSFSPANHGAMGVSSKTS